jgi:hypothetical protein
MSVNYPEGWSGFQMLGAGQPSFYRIWNSISSCHRRQVKRLRKRRQRYLQFHFQMMRKLRADRQLA